MKIAQVIHRWRVAMVYLVICLLSMPVILQNIGSKEQSNPKKVSLEFPSLENIRVAGDSQRFALLHTSSRQIDVFDYKGILLDSVRREILSDEACDFVGSGKIVFQDFESSSGRIIVHDIQNKKNIQFDVLKNPISILRGTGTHNFIAAGSIKGELGLFDLGKKQLVWTIRDTKGEVDDIFVDERGRFLGLRIGYGIRLLELKKGTKLNQFREEKGKILANGFVEDSIMWFSESGILTQIHTNTFRSIKTQILKGKLPSCAAFSKDGSWLAIGGNNGTVRIHSTRDEKIDLKITISPEWRVRNIAFSPNNEHLIVHVFDKRSAVLGEFGSVLSIIKLTLPK